MTSRPLHGRTVLVCRARDQAGPTIERLAEHGADVVHLPLLEIVLPADGGRGLRGALAHLDSYSWIVFTSTNAVDAVAARLEGDDDTSRRDMTPRVAVVGPATEAACRAVGWTVDFVAPRATAAALAESLPVDVGARVLAPLAELAKDDLVSGLRARGVQVDTVTAYRSVTPDHEPAALDAAAGADAVLVTSPSTIDRLTEVLGPDRVPAVVIAIGPSSAAAVGAHGIAVTAVAEPHDLDGLIDATVRTLAR